MPKQAAKKLDGSSRRRPSAQDSFLPRHDATPSCRRAGLSRTKIPSQILNRPLFRGPLAQREPFALPQRLADELTETA